MDNSQLLNHLYNKYMLTEKSVKDLRKRMIFARAHLCSSSLLQWGGNRREFISEEKTKKIWELLTNNPNSIDNYYVRNFGDGSMNHVVEKRAKATEKNFEELIKLIQNTEKFIKEELEKGTKFEGEFEKNFPQFVKGEEESWNYYEMKNKEN